MNPETTKCTCGELFIKTRHDEEGCDLCPSCYTEFRNAIYHAQHTWTPYQPSNGTERMRFTSGFCDSCHYDGDVEQDKGCHILALTFLFRLENKEYPKEWVQNELGEPTCTKFKTEEQWRKEHKKVVRVPENQMSLL